jgi:hypothetical protein
MQLLTEKSGEQ